MKDNPFLRRSNILEKNQEYLNKVVKTISQIFAEVIKNDGKLIFAGNGGSAAEAQHMSAEYVGTLVTSNKRDPIPSIALSTDTSFITAWSNDNGYEDIFRRQLQALAKKNDCFKVTKNIDYVFVCSAVTSGAKVILNKPLDHLNPNLIMNTFLLESSYNNKIKKFIFR